MKIAVFFLVVVAALWGLTFPLLENSMQEHDPFVFVALRFGLAALIMMPYLFKHVGRKEVLVPGILLGLLNCAAYLTQTIGMQTVHSSRAAFITGANVLFIPFLSFLFKTGQQTVYEYLSAFVCMLGVFVLIGCDIGQVTGGDLWILGCAFSVALSIIYIARVTKQELDPYLLTGSQIVMTALFSSILCLFFAEFHFSSLQSSTFLPALLYCSIFGTIATLALQAKYQKYVTAQKAALIFSLEPVFASAFDVLINDAELDMYLLVGGFFILLSIGILEIPNRKKEPALL